MLRDVPAFPSWTEKLPWRIWEYFMKRWHCTSTWAPVGSNGEHFGDRFSWAPLFLFSLNQRSPHPKWEQVTPNCESTTLKSFCFFLGTWFLLLIGSSNPPLGKPIKLAQDAADLGCWTNHGVSAAKKSVVDKKDLKKQCRCWSRCQQPASVVVVVVVDLTLFSEFDVRRLVPLRWSPRPGQDPIALPISHWGGRKVVLAKD